MPTLPQTEAWQVGPTVDANMELVAPTFRQEPHEITAGNAPIDLRAAKPRPITHRPDFQLRAAPAVALTRMANQNPAGAGADGEQAPTAVTGASGALSQAPGEGVGRFVPVVLVGAAIGMLLASGRRG